MLEDPRTRLVIIAMAFVAMAAGVAYGYDSTRDDLIAKGVRVAGVDVGAMREPAARAKLRAELTARLERPIRVAAAGRRFRLTASRSQLAPDLEAMVDEALARSRSGGLPGRIWRDVTGRRVEADLPARVTYSELAVRRFVRRVKHAVDRPPRDAAVKFKTASLPAIRSQTGLKLNGDRLRRSVAAALAQIGRARTIRVDVRVIQPQVTSVELAKKYPYVITIDRPGFALRLFKRLKLTKTYKIAVGRIGLETPAGLYHIQDKVVNPSWHVPNSPWAGELAGRVIPPGPDDPLKARWLGIFDGAGIHGTEDIGSLGTAASHGCIRMSIPDVIDLYNQVPVRTPVYIQ